MLGRVPLFGSDIVKAIQPAIGKKALSVSQGQVRTWLHRALGGIKDERVFQQLFLRLAQGGLPEYAQVRHGPLEYGKDVVVLVEQDQKPVLLMYQAKVGNLTKRNWSKTQSQLEEMFQVDLASLQLPRTPEKRKGILILTGHVDPHVEPTLSGWLAEQQRDHHRRFEVMHLDVIVRWIVDGRLINEFRAAVKELGLRPEDMGDGSKENAFRGEFSLNGSKGTDG
jgi:hypothetical protein